MHGSKIDRKETGLFKEHQLKLIYEQQQLSEFIGQPFDKSAFKGQISLKENSFTAGQRVTLSEALRRQYRDIESPVISKQIASLEKENSFTVTTGHQLSVFTGPLYLIIKILHVIKLSEKLNHLYPDYHFVPVYWMASEDHDYEEIKSFHLFNSKITWGTEQSGAVGRFDLEGFDQVISEIKEIYAQHPSSEIFELLDKYRGKSFAEATRNFVHHLFEERGLLIIDGDDAALKNAFRDVMKREITEEFSLKAVKETNDRLDAVGLPQQVYPREINLFYLDHTTRSRIEKIKDAYKIKEDTILTQDEILKMVDEHPEKLSPNVVLRPLYQEIVLPNLAYVGGTGEITYWLQLKGVFDAVNVPYPLVQVRNSVLWIDKNMQRKMRKIDLQAKDLFKSSEQLKKDYLKDHEGVDLDFTSMEEALKTLEEKMTEMIVSTDPMLGNFAGAETRRLEKVIETVKSKLIRSEKSKHDQAMKVIDDLKFRLFPNNGLQERHTNFFSFCADGNYTNVLNDLYNELDPFSNDLIIIQDE